MEHITAQLGGLAIGTPDSSKTRRAEVSGSQHHCQGILKHAAKKFKKGDQRSLEVQIMALSHRFLRKVAGKCKDLKRTHTTSHPKESGRSPATFRTEEARIFAVNIWADPRTRDLATAAIKQAMEGGLEYNIEPDEVYYVEADDVMDGIYELGYFYWEKKRGPIRVHNSSHLMG
jgi:hypothetical protein